MDHCDCKQPKTMCHSLSSEEIAIYEGQCDHTDNKAVILSENTFWLYKKVEMVMLLFMLACFDQNGL